MLRGRGVCVCGGAGCSLYVPHVRLLALVRGFHFRHWMTRKVGHLAVFLPPPLECVGGLGCGTVAIKRAHRGDTAGRGWQRVCILLLVTANRPFLIPSSEPFISIPSFPLHYCDARIRLVTPRCGNFDFALRNFLLMIMLNK